MAVITSASDSYMSLAIPSTQIPLISYQRLTMTRNYLRVYDHRPVGSTDITYAQTYICNHISQ